MVELYQSKSMCLGTVDKMGIGILEKLCEHNVELVMSFAEQEIPLKELLSVITYEIDDPIRVLKRLPNFVIERV